MKELMRSGIILLSILMLTGIAYGIDGDLDNDGVLDDIDLCPESIAEITACDDTYVFLIELEDLRPNRWLTVQWCGSPISWAVRSPNGRANGWFWQISRPLYGEGGTYGCTCLQIVDYMEALTGEKFNGHRKHGCSTSLIQDFINMVSDE